MTNPGSGKGRRQRGRGRLASAAAYLFLIVAGFSVGMTAGLLWEEPGLLMAYLLGETKAVAWESTPGPEAVPEVAARPPPDALPADPQVRREQERRAEAEIPAIASAPPGRFVIQVGAFSDSRSAERLAGSLRAKGFEVYVSPGTTKAKGARWRVRVGPLATREEADRTAARLKSEEKLPTWVLEEDAN